MEHTDKIERNWKRKAVTIIMIALLIFVIVMQFRIVKTILDNKAMLDADPLVVAANKYGIESCFCSEGKRVIEFNKNFSKTTIIRKAAREYGLYYNLSNLNELFIKEDSVGTNQTLIKLES